MTRQLVLALCLAAASLAAQSERGGAWFGTPVPAAASDPRKPVMKYDDVFAPVPVRFAHRPGRFDELLDGAALKKDHKTIVVSLYSWLAFAWPSRSARLRA